MQLEKLISVNSNFQLQWEKAQDCYVLLYPEGMVQLSQSAGEIMYLCDQKNTIHTIVQLLEDKFNVVGLQNDVVEFVTDAMQRKWLVYDGE